MHSLRFSVLAALLAGLCAVHGRSTRGIGKASDIREAPWLVQFEYAQAGRGDFRAMSTCAGTIIDSTHILSAAHCFDSEDVRFPVGHVLARVGATDKKSGGQTYHIESIVEHPKAEGGAGAMFDLAVVTLFKPIQFSETVQPIAFAKKAVPGHTIAKGGGWGTQPDESFAPGLLTFNVEKEDPEECQATLAFSNIAKDARGGLMCNIPRGGMPCAGDSGSGLWLPAADGQPAQLFGVLHGGTVCDTEKGSALYVDVLHEEVRDFLSEYFDLSGSELTKSAKAPEPSRPTFTLGGGSSGLSGLEALLGGLGGGKVISLDDLQGLNFDLPPHFRLD